MIKFNFQKYQKKFLPAGKQSGAAMLISVIFFLFIALAIIAGLVGPSVREFKNAATNLNSKKSYFLAESGNEDAFYRLENNMTIGNNESLSLNSNLATTTITTLSDGSKQISSLGDVSSYQRKNILTLRAGEGVSFHYGMQIGSGGLNMDNSSTINGNVYVNGNITGTNNQNITGTAIATGTIDNVDIGQSGVGDAIAHTVKNSIVVGHLYCHIGSGNNKSCDTSQGDPVPLNFPISDSQIQSWKDAAVAGGTQTGNISLSDHDTLTLGPKKIVGNLDLNSYAILTITGPLWVTGNITLENQSQVNLPSSYGSGSGMIVSDGTVSAKNTSSFGGSGASGSYIMMLTTSTADKAIDIENSNQAAILAAPYGGISFLNSSAAKEVIAKAVSMSNSGTLTYESGLVNVNFVSGPSGGYSISGWQETQ